MGYQLGMKDNSQSFSPCASFPGDSPYPPSYVYVIRSRKLGSHRRENHTLQRMINSTAFSTSIADQPSSIEQIAKLQNVRRRSHSDDTAPIGRGEKLMAQLVT